VLSRKQKELLKLSIDKETSRIKVITNRDMQCVYGCIKHGKNVLKHLVGAGYLTIVSGAQYELTEKGAKSLGYKIMRQKK